MKKNLLDIFVQYLHEQLTIQNLGFTQHKLSNGINYSLCSIENSIDFDTTFLKEHIESYYYILDNKNQNIVPTIMKKLIVEHPDLLFSQLSTLPYFYSKKRGLGDTFPTLTYSFEHNDLVTVFKNYSDKNLITNNFYSFMELLANTELYFQHDKEYINIMLHTFKLHEPLIKKTNGNLIAIRSWCIAHLSDTSQFEKFYTIENNDPILSDTPFKTSISLLDLKAIESQFILNNAKGKSHYQDFLKSFVFILNFDSIKKQFSLENTEGQSVFNNKHFQLTFYHNDNFNYVHINKNIPVLLKILCDYTNNDNKNIDDFEHQIFKAFQYHTLHDKFAALEKNKKKAPKI